MYPYLWSTFFWTMLHAIGKAFANHYPDAIPPELSESLFHFITNICKYLPCPGCRYHCIAYANQVPPRFTKGTEVWKYFFDFHNSVNKRTKKLEVSDEEANAVLAKQLGEFGWVPEKIEEAFFQDWWTALLMTSFSISLTPDHPKEEEKKEFQSFMHHAAMVMPFSFKKLGSGTLVRTVLVSFVDSPAFDLTNRDTVFEAITNMHNTVCSEFGINTKMVKEMKDLFAKNFEQKNVTETIRAVQMHEEDQKKLLAMQEELNELRASKVGGSAETASGTTTGVNSSYEIATIALSCLLGVILLIMVMAWLTYRYKWAGEWKFVRVGADHKQMKGYQDVVVSSSSSSSDSN